MLQLLHICQIASKWSQLSRFIRIILKMFSLKVRDHTNKMILKNKIYLLIVVIFIFQKIVFTEYSRWALYYILSVVRSGTHPLGIYKKNLRRVKEILFSVAKATLQPPMSVRLSVTKSPNQLSKRQYENSLLIINKSESNHLQQTIWKILVWFGNDDF